MELQGSQGVAPHPGLADRVDEIVRRGKEAYLADALLQEAGDSLMMKLGEAANRLSRLGVLAPDGVEWALAVANRNFIIHQYDEINRELTWLTLSRDLPAWKVSLQASSMKQRRRSTEESETGHAGGAEIRPVSRLGPENHSRVASSGHIPARGAGPLHRRRVFAQVSARMLKGQQSWANDARSRRMSRGRRFESCPRY